MSTELYEGHAQQSLVFRSKLTEVCANRDAAINFMHKAIEAMALGKTLAEESLKYAESAYEYANFTLEDSSKYGAYQRLFQSIDPEESFEAYRQQIDARVWMNVLSLTGMEYMMDRTAKDELYKQLLSSVPEVTEDNITRTLQSLQKDSYLIFQRGLVRAFTDLDRRFRSHDGFKIGSRIILTNVFNEWGSWNYRNGMRETICDVERIFSVLDGNKPNPKGLLDALTEGRGLGLGAHQSYTESQYFKIRGYENGNAHLWFTRDDLVEKANLILAEYYGEVLPDGVPEDVTEQDIRSKSTALCKDLSYYPTPSHIVSMLLDTLCVSGGKRVLEPSAGTGNFVRHLLKNNHIVDAVEIDPRHLDSLYSLSQENKNLTVKHANFLTLHPNPIYDLVCMNPPFYGTHYIQHIMHAFEFLKPGGMLISIVPATAEFRDSKICDVFRKWVKKYSNRYSSTFKSLPSDSFISSGTRVNTSYIVLDKP